MRIARDDVPVKIAIDGATARQQTDFGSAEGCGTMAGEYFSMAAGVDLAPLLEGLEDNLCQSAHWGYLAAGRVVVTFADGSEETVNHRDLFYWKPGHTVRVLEDAELILFSPQHEHVAVVEHVKEQLAG